CGFVLSGVWSFIELTWMRSQVQVLHRPPMQRGPSWFEGPRCIGGFWRMNLRPEGGCGGTSVPPGGKGRNRRGLATPRREPRRQIPFGAPTAIGRRGSRRPTVGGSRPAPPTKAARSLAVVLEGPRHLGV